MAIITHSGTISSPETWDMVNDSHQITGHLTLAALVTIDVGASGAYNEAIQVTAGYYVYLNTSGGWRSINTSNNRRYVIESSAANPVTGSWNGFKFQGAIDANSDFSYLKIMDALYALWFSNNAANGPTMAWMVFENCARCISNFASIGGGISITLSNVLMDSCGKAGADRLFECDLVGTIVIDRLYVTRCRTNAGFNTFSSGANITLNTLIVDNSYFSSNFFLGNSAVSGSLTISDIFITGMNQVRFLFDFDSTATVDINRGLIASDYITMQQSNGSNNTVDNVGFIGDSYLLVLDRGPLCNNISVRGGGDNNNRLRREILNTVTGSPVNSGAINNTNRTGTTTEQYPPTITTPTVSGSPGSADTTLAFTCGRPGATFIVWGTSSVTIANEDDLWNYGNQSGLDYHEKLDYSGRAKLWDDITARSQEIQGHDSSVTIYARVVQRDEFEDRLNYSDEMSFTAATPPDTSVYPAENRVLSDAGNYGPTGSENTPNFIDVSISDVETGVIWGGAGIKSTGVFDVPIESDVNDGTGYGANGTEFTGTLVIPDTNQYGMFTAELSAKTFNVTITG